MGIGNKFNLPLQYQSQYDFDAYKDNIVEWSFTRERPRHFLYAYSDNMRPDATIDHIKDARNYSRLNGLETPDLGETLSTELFLGAEYGFSGFVGEDVAGAAYRRSYLTDTSENVYAPLGRTGDKAPAPTPEGAGIFGSELVTKFTELFSSGSALGNLFLGTSPYQDVIDNLDYRETDEKYLDAAGEFKSMEYFQDTFAENYHLMSTLDRVGFSRDEILRTKNKRTLDYLVLRAVARSSMEDKIAKYDEAAGFYNGTFARMILNLPALIYNDPDLPATLGVGAVVGGLVKIGKGALKGIGKSLSREFSEEAVDGFTRQALRQKTGMAAARIFKQAGKSSSFAKYVQNGFKLEANALKRYKLLDLGAKGIVIAGFQGGVSDIVSQGNVINEAGVLGRINDQDSEFDYNRLLMATAASAVFGGTISGVAGAFARPRNASIDASRNLSSALTDVSEAQLAAGRSYVEGTPLLEDLSVSKSVNEAESKQTVRDVSRTEESPLIKAVDKRDPETSRYIISEAKEDPNEKVSDVIRTKDVAKKQRFAANIDKSIAKVEKRLREKAEKTGELSARDAAFLGTLKRQAENIKRKAGVSEKAIVPAREALDSPQKREGLTKNSVVLPEQEQIMLKKSGKTLKENSVKTRGRTKGTIGQTLNRKQKAHAKKAIKSRKYFEDISPEHKRLHDFFEEMELPPGVILMLRGVFSNENSRYLQNLVYKFVDDPNVNRLGSFAPRYGDVDLETPVTISKLLVKGSGDGVRYFTDVEIAKVIIHEIAGHGFMDTFSISEQLLVKRAYEDPEIRSVFKEMISDYFEEIMGPKARLRGEYAISNVDEFFAAVSEMVLFDRYDRVGLIDYAMNLSVGLDTTKRFNLIQLISVIYNKVGEKISEALNTVLMTVGDFEEAQRFFRDKDFDPEQQKVLGQLADLRKEIEDDMSLVGKDDRYITATEYVGAAVSAQRHAMIQVLDGNFLKNELKKPASERSPLVNKLSSITDKVFNDDTYTLKDLERELRELGDQSRELIAKDYSIGDFLKFVRLLQDSTSSFSRFIIAEVDSGDITFKDILSERALMRVILDPLRLEYEIHYAELNKGLSDAEIKKIVDKEMEYKTDSIRHQLEIVQSDRWGLELGHIEQAMPFMVDTGLLELIYPGVTARRETVKSIARLNRDQRIKAYLNNQPDPGRRTVLDSKASELVERIKKQEDLDKIEQTLEEIETAQLNDLTGPKTKSIINKVHKRGFISDKEKEALLRQRDELAAEAKRTRERADWEDFVSEIETTLRLQIEKKINKFIAKGHEDLKISDLIQLENGIENGFIVVEDGKLRRAEVKVSEVTEAITTDKVIETSNENPNNPVEAVLENVNQIAKETTEIIEDAGLDSETTRVIKEENIADESLPLTEDGKIDVVVFLANEKNLGAVRRIIGSRLRDPNDVDDAIGGLYLKAAEERFNPDPANTTTKSLINFLAKAGINDTIKASEKVRGVRKRKTTDIDTGEEVIEKVATISSFGEDPAAAAVRDPGAVSLRGTERGEKVKSKVFATVDDYLEQGYFTERDAWIIKTSFEAIGNKKLKVEELRARWNSQFNENIGREAFATAVRRAKQKFAEGDDIEVDMNKTEALIPVKKDTEPAKPKVVEEAVSPEDTVETTPIFEPEKDTVSVIENEASTGIVDVSAKDIKKANTETITSDDSVSSKSNKNAVKKAKTGEPVELTISVTRTNTRKPAKIEIGSTNKKRAEANRQDVEKVETGEKKTTVITTATVRPENPVVTREPITTVEDLIDLIPNDLLIVEGVSTAILKSTLLKTVTILRDMGELKSRQDQYDFVMKYLKDSHGIDAVIKVEGEEAIILLPPDLPRNNISNEVHYPNGQVKSDTIKIDEDSQLLNEDGTPKPLDQRDEHVVQNGVEVRDETVIETESSVRDVEKDSLQDQIESFILSDNEFLNNLGADIPLVSRLIALFPDYVTSFDSVSRLVGGFLMETKKIIDRNLANYGDEGVKFYWQTVLELRMENDVLKQRIANMKEKGETVAANLIRKVKTVDEIYESAAIITTKKFKDKKKAAFVAPLTPEKYDPVTGSKVFETAQQKAEREVKEIGGGSKKRTILRKFFNKKSGDNHRYVRAQGLVGAVFGGEDSSASNWWRKAMTNIVLFAQVGSGLKDTVYSHVDVLMALSKFVDNTKLHTGHFINGGKRPIKTWMQSDALVKRRMGRLTQRRARLLRLSKKAFPVVMKYVHDTRINKGKITKGDLINALKESDVPLEKVNQVVDKLFPALEDFNRELTDIYRQIFDLQEETGWKFINEIEGSDKLDPETYIPITFDANRIEGNLEEVVQAMTNVRRKSIKERDTIHKSLMYALGWLPSTFEETDPVSNLFKKDRDIDGKAITNNRDLLSRVVETQLDSESLDNLTLARTLTNPLDSVGANERLYGRLGRAWFVVKQEDEYLVVKIPNKLDELSVADRAKYQKAVDGDVTDYTPTHLEILKRSKNDDIIQAEMMELLSFKLGRGVYGSGVKIGVNNTPILGLADPAKKGSGVWIQNITPEEVAMDGSLAQFIQIDPTLTTLDFMNGRLFELHAQRELDRLLGSKGIRMYEFLSEAESIAINRIENEGHSPKDTDMLVKSVKNGMKKLREQYSMYSQHLSQIDDDYSSLAVNAGTLSQNLLTSAVSWGFGVLALTETILVKSGYGIDNVLHPANIVKDTALLIRNILGDLRYDRAADRIEVADTIFAFDLLNRNNSARFLSELDEGVQLTSGLMEKIFGPRRGAIPERIDSGPLGFVQRRVSNLAYFAREVGSLQQVTNANRMMATPKYTRMFIKLIKGNKIDELISVLETKEVRSKIKKLEEEAVTDRSKQAELVKYIKGLAREVGGMDYQTVSSLLQYGLLNRKSIDALRLGFKESGLRVDGGRIDLMQLNNFVLDLRTNKRKVEGLDPDVLEDAIDSLTFMVEQLVITRAITETQGLAQGTGVVARHPLGRLLTSLFGWINAFHYNVFTNYGNRTSPKYLIGTLMMAGIANAVAMTFRQWIRGRDPEDILLEMEEDPLRFLALSVQGIPALGRFNSIIDGGVAGIQMMVGSTPQHLFSPFGVPGLEALPKAGTDIARGFNKTYDYISGQNNTTGVDAAAALTKSAQLDGMINNSFLALPVRIFESADIMKEGNALREYLDTVQYAETPYQDAAKRSKTKFKINSIDNIRNSSLREDMAVMDAKRENLKRSLKINSISPQEMKERVQKNFSIQTGDFYRSPRKAEMTPEASETLESFREPSRASQKLADILEEQDE